MKGKWFTRLLILFFAISVQNQLSAQNVELTTQAQVDAFVGTKINGYLLIRGNDIDDLSPLNTLDTVTHSIFIEYNRSLKVLNGFDNLIYNGGSLIITSNPELDSIGTFGKVKKIKGPLVLTHNPVLRECCAFYPLLTETQGVIWGGTIIKGNKGCNSEKELRENCDEDSDNDGVEDAEDGCPQDSLKIHPGICGCGVAELDGDKDGTPDCEDECPADPNKILAGDCGCGRKDTDSDQDGVADCIDDCPSNPAITKASICGCANPRILDIKVDNIGACNDNGTPSGLDDTYPVDVTLVFEGVPTSGKVLITGGTSESISFSTNSTSKSYTLFGVPFYANGALIEVIATFEGNENCTKRRVFGIFGASSCSSGACDPPSTYSADTENYPNGALLTWSDLGIGTTYEVNYKPSGSNNWAIQSVSSNQLLVDGLSDYTDYEYQIRAYCDGQKYSEYAIGTFTTGGKECKLVRAEVQNINCQDNQTPDDTSDDYFSFNLYVEGINVGENYTIDQVVGETRGTYNSLQTFTTAVGTLGKGNINIIIKDDKDVNCQINATVTDPGICSNDCLINYITIDRVIKCYDRGSRWIKSDDFFTADLTVYFTNAPASGELKLTGKTRGKVSTEGLQNSTSYTFTEVRVPAGGKDFSIGATFTNGLDCEYSAIFKGLLVSENKICWDECNIMNAQVVNVQCADNSTNEVDDDYLTFELVVTGTNLIGNYQIANVAGTSIGTYNEPSFFRTNGGIGTEPISLQITDTANPDCMYEVIVKNSCPTGQFRTNNHLANLTQLRTPSIKLYPNPAKEELFLEYPITSSVQVEVFDLLGQKIIDSKITNQRIDISQLNTGIYHLVVREGATFQTIKFVKE